MSSSGNAAGDVPGSAAPIDPHDQDTCTPPPTKESLDLLPTDEILNSQIDGPESSNSGNGITDRIPEALTAGAQSAGDAYSGPELLRRLSLVSDTAVPQPSFAHPEDHPDLGLSGRVISAAFCIPYKLGFRSGEPWTLNHRPGTSALFDSFAYLASSQTPWSHTLVGWTGEIERQTNIRHDGTVDKTPPAPLNKATAPIPVDPLEKPSYPQPDNIRVSHADRRRLEEQLDSSKYGSVLPVWLSDELESPTDDITLCNQGRWRRYPERIIYPLFHYKIAEASDGRAESRWYHDYERLNNLFADRILETYKPGDVVWIHDYHLFLLPGILRQRIPNIYIGFFLHIPFPSSEFLRCLSKRKDILTGVLGSNMIGFQSFTYTRHFSSCCTRVLRFDSDSAGIDAYGAHVAVDAFPIGIDVDAVRKVTFGEPKVERTVAEIRNIYGDTKIIIGRDRLDSVRGVTQKLMAFEKFLERYPEWQDKVVLIQVTSPTSVEEEKEESDSKLSGQMSDLISSINGRFGSISFSPVQHYPQYLSRNEYFALLRTADVGLITSVRDGMNTTSLEYVVAQREKHSPLILSEFSGTAGSLRDAIHINPWDLSGVSEAINRALTMSDKEKSKQHHELYSHVATHTVQKWSEQFLKRLLTTLSSFNQSIATPALDSHKLVTRYLNSRRRLFMFDYDGTLTPIVKDPQAAIPSDRVIRTIKTLAADPRNAVWVISGRDQAFLEEWMGHISELGLSAEHGCFIRKPGEEEWESLAGKSGAAWHQKAVDIFQEYNERTQGAFIERKRVAVTWHYRRVDPEYGAYKANEVKKHLEDTLAKEYGLEVMAGKANLEIRPTFVNKGAIAKRLVNEFHQTAGQYPDFILCLGDDFTDEDMFRALRDAKLPANDVFSVTVGASSKQTDADWHLLEPSDVIATLTLLNEGSVALADGRTLRGHQD